MLDYINTYIAMKIRGPFTGFMKVDIIVVYQEQILQRTT